MHSNLFDNVSKGLLCGLRNTALHTLHSTLYTPHSPLHTLHSTLHTLHSTLHHTLHFTHSSLHTLHSTLLTLHSTLQTLHFPLRTPHSTLYNSTLLNYFTLHTPHSTLSTPHSALYTFHSTFRTGNRRNMCKTVQINYCRKVFCVTAYPCVSTSVPLTYMWAFGFVGCILFFKLGVWDENLVLHPKWNAQRDFCFNILTSKCVSRHNDVHLLDISTAKSAPEPRTAFNVLISNLLRATTAWNFSSLIWPDGSAPAALASLLFDSPEPKKIRKTERFGTFPFFRVPWSSFFFLSLLWPFPPLLSPCVHIVGILWNFDFWTSVGYVLRL